MPEKNQSKYYVGIDLGTGSTKAVAMDERGKTLCSSQHHYPTITAHRGYSEQDPELIWKAVITCINEITGQLGAAPVAVGFSSAMHSILPVDKDGHALSNAILWADGRAGGIAEALRSAADGEDIYRTTGTAVYAMSPLCKLIWLRQNQAELFNHAYKFVSIKEYVWQKLFGVFEVDHSIASATGLFDIVQHTWYDGALSLAGVEVGKLSKPVPTGHIQRLHQPHKLLPDITPDVAFVIGASDGCCANFGGNAIKPGVGALTIGTSGAVRVGSTKPVYNYAAMTFNYLLDTHTYICGGAVNNGGAAVDWLLKNFLKQERITADSYDTLFAAIDSVKAGSEGLVFLPYLYAERAPVWDAKSSGAFININARHKQQHFLRAGLEGICYALHDVLNAVESSSGERVDQLVISGGFISSAVWVQVLADITGKQLVLLQGEDLSAVGAIYLAMRAVGEDVQPILDAGLKSSTIVRPDMDNYATYSSIFPVYKKLYQDIKFSVHQLQDLGL